MTLRSLRLTSCALAAALTFLGMSATAEAAASGSVLPSGGVGLSLNNNANALENIAIDNSKIRANTASAITVIPEEHVAAAAAAEPTEEELFRNLVIAQVRSYVNVRDIPSEKGQIVGKFYDDSVGTFLEEEDGWYKIQSGNVTGYVKGEYCVTGDEAVELAKKVGTRFARVTTTTLKVRKEPGLDASVLGLVPMDDELVVLDETEEWAQVDVEEGIGWVSKEFVELHTEFVKAESKAEEEARLAKEAAARKKAREAAAAKVAASNPDQPQSSSSPASASAVVVANENSSEMGVAVAQYALQFVGNPYVYGGSSLTNGTDCSGFVMSVYSNFGVSLPHSSAADRNQGYGVEGGLENAQPGDLICYSGHVALYIGDGQIVHASTKKTGIIVSKADYKKILAIRRIF